jgi:hypothetical protein
MRKLFTIALTLSSISALARSGDVVRPYELMQQNAVLQTYDRIPTNTEDKVPSNLNKDNHLNQKHEIGPKKDI